MQPAHPIATAELLVSTADRIKAPFPRYGYFMVENFLYLLSHLPFFYLSFTVLDPGDPFEFLET